MTTTVLICGKLFDGVGEELREHSEILIEGGVIAQVAGSVSRPDRAQVINLSDRTVAPGFIDAHVHLCLDGLNLQQQTLQCAPIKRWPDCIWRSSICAMVSPHCATWARWIRTDRRSICAMQSMPAWFTGRA
jgi:predicted amidohydrolase YtcJ